MFVLFISCVHMMCTKTYTLIFSISPSCSPAHIHIQQSDGTCVRVMMTDYANDPSFTNFTDVPGAECLDFWITAEDDGSQQPQGTIHIPATTPEGPYTLLWYWDFTEFWYSACIDIEVTNDVTVGNTPSPTITPDVVDDAEIQVYLHNGCSGLDYSTTFCQEYTTDPNSYCNVNEVDECGRSICTGIANFLFECPQNCPVGCPIPKAFYDDFSSNTLDEHDWLVAEKSWGSGGSFVNGGVVPENVQSDSSAGTVKFNAHGNLYTGDVMGINKDLSRQNTGVRTGGAIATRRYLGPGSYEVRMKVAGELGVCSAIWTFFYNDDEYCESGADIVNHEIDIELPGRPGAPSTNIDFAQALTNTWTGEIGALHTTGYTSLPKNVDDGEFHTYRFDWHTDQADRRVEFYLDGDYLTTITTNVPFFAGRMWLGAWFPNSWAGEPNFDVEVMEVDYFKFTPFDEDYECLAESYPNFGWASGTNFGIGNDEQLCGTYTSSPTTHVTKSPTSQPTHPPSSPPQSTGNYLDIGCADLPDACSTYCKDYAGQQDSCGRSVCHGDSHSDLNPCPSPTTGPTTPSPNTASPTTSSPITASPTTSSPITASPITSSPNTDSPTTSSPITASPTTSSPNTDSPTTASPNTASPSKQPTDSPIKSPVTGAGTCSEDSSNNGSSCSNDDDCTCASAGSLPFGRRLVEEEEEKSHRNLAAPSCNDGTCRKKCLNCPDDSQECTTCLGTEPQTTSPTSTPSSSPTSCGICIFPSTSPPTSSPTPAPTPATADCTPGDGSRNAFCCDDSHCTSGNCKNSGSCGN